MPGAGVAAGAESEAEAGFGTAAGSEGAKTSDLLVEAIGVGGSGARRSERESGDRFDGWIGVPDGDGGGKDRSATAGDLSPGGPRRPIAKAVPLLGALPGDELGTFP